MKAAELTLENPEQFVGHYKVVQVGRRAIALSADEGLALENLYFIMPMDNLNAALSASDVNYPVAKKSTARILPEQAYVPPLLSLE